MIRRLNAPFLNARTDIARPSPVMSWLFERSITGMLKSRTFIATLCLAAATAPAWAADAKPAEVRETAPLGETIEKQLAPDVALKLWSQDDSIYQQNRGDRIEIQSGRRERGQDDQAAERGAAHPLCLRRLRDSGRATSACCATVLEGMKDRRNVRLHFVGHSDDVPLRLAPSRSAWATTSDCRASGPARLPSSSSVPWICRRNRFPTKAWGKPAARQQCHPGRQGAEPARGSGGLVRRDWREAGREGGDRPAKSSTASRSAGSRRCAS
jgi:hypothetical protein